jgi:phospholipase C
MGFFNVQQGDVPYFKKLADAYTMSDNYHQAVNGGTGANHIMLDTGDAIWFSDGNGNPLTPPNNPVNPANPGTPVTGFTSALNEIENPNPQPGTNNYYTQDGYGGGSGSPGRPRPTPITAAVRTPIARTSASPAWPPSSAICKGCSAK